MACSMQRGKKMIRRMVGHLWHLREGGFRGTKLINTRTRLLPDGEILLMGAFHHDHAPDCSPLHKLYAPAKEGRGHTRNGHIDICW